MGDLHLTDRPQDSYRFGIFPWLRQQQAKYKPEATFLMGDLTDAKDRHSSALVNKIVSSLLLLEQPIFIIKGNHDYIDPNNPYFGFLNNFERIRFLSETVKLADLNVGVIPHVAKEDAFAAAIGSVEGSDYILFHNTIAGAIAETGGSLSGFSQAPIRKAAPRYGAYAGDIHRPQQCGAVTYVGSPYSIRFGDHFEPRVLLLDGAKKTNLYFDAPRKWALHVGSAEEITNDGNLVKGDQVKVTIALAREEATGWAAHKEAIMLACQQKGVAVYGIDVEIHKAIPTKEIVEPAKLDRSQIVEAFCTSENVPSRVREVGVAFLK